MKNATFKALARLIDLVLQHRVPVVSAVIGFTCVMAYLAAQIEVKTVFSDLLPLADRRRIELGVEGEPAAFTLRGDAGLLTVLLRNLLDNAVRYAPEGSSVVLRFAASGLQVENAGPPLPAQTQAHLGERFRRPDGQAESGSGLGISIVQRIAALHGLALHPGTWADGQGVVMSLSAP